MKSNYLNKILSDQLPMVKNDFKSLFESNKQKAEYILRQILQDLDFPTSNTNNNLIQSRIFGNHLYTISFCPELNFEIPQKFMFDDVRKTKISNPTIYSNSRKVLDVSSSFFKIYISDKKDIVEIPVRLTAHEIQKGTVFGDYKGYLNLFSVDKVMGNKTIPEELDVLVLKSIINEKLDSSNKIDISKNNIDEYRKKVITSWTKNKSKSKNSKFIEKNIIFNSLIKNFIESLDLNEEKKVA